MWKLKKMKIGKILFPCGISSAVFGTFFGSVFGFEHLLDPMYKALFGLEEKPFEDTVKKSKKGPLVLAIIILIVLLILALVVGVIALIVWGIIALIGSIGGSAVIGLLF